MINRFFKKNFMAAILFIAFTFLFSVVNLVVSFKPIIECLSNEKISKSSLKETIKNLETTINENIYGRYKFIDGYGYVQRLMEKNEESNFEVVKDEEGLSHYTYFADKPNSTEEIVRRTIAFSKGVETEKKKFIYLMPPDKYIEGFTRFPTGIPYNYANEVADNFLAELKKNNISTIDLRENLDKSGIAGEELFFKTDHHWRIPTVFWEFGQLVEKLNKEYGLSIDENGFYRDKDNYNIINYNNVYIGSMGRKAGIYYSGVDDFTLIYPKFRTNYDFYAKTGQQESKLEGRFEDALLAVYPLRVKKGRYALEADKYFSYLYGNQGIVHVRNKEVPSGPKFLFIKDSLTVPLAAFLSTVSSDIYLIDPRYYKEDIPEFAKQVDVDFIFMAFYPQNLIEEFFPFYELK